MTEQPKDVDTKDDLQIQAAETLNPTLANLDMLAYLSPLNLQRRGKVTKTSKANKEYKQEFLLFASSKAEREMLFLLPMGENKRYPVPFAVRDFIARIEALTRMGKWTKIIQAEGVKNNITGEKEWIWTIPEQKSM